MRRKVGARQATGLGNAGVKLPSDAGIVSGDRAWRRMCEQGSADLLAAMQRYYRRHGRGLPGGAA